MLYYFYNMQRNINKIFLKFIVIFQVINIKLLDNIQAYERE